MKKVKNLKKIVALIMCTMMLFATGITTFAEAIPRVIITGYDSTPEEIVAGEEFTLTLHIDNKSSKTAISNMKLTLSTAGNEFIPVSGSGVIYVDKIPAGESMDVSIDMRAKATLETNTYIVTIVTEYEDKYSMPYTDTTNLSVSVKQKAIVGVTDETIMPAEIQTGQRSNIMFSVNNQGKCTIYNVNVKIVGEGIDQVTSFIGNIQPGLTGYADITVTGKAPCDKGVKAVISYEDAEGNIEEITKDLGLTVTENNQIEEIDISDDKKEVTTEEESNNVLPIVIIGVVVLLIVVKVIVDRKKRKEEED